MNRNVLYGLVASVVLFVVYLGILTALESFGHALQQFAQLWYLMVPLIAGFGVQIGLYSYIRTESRRMASGGATGSVAASGGVSAGSMVLCCLHHVTDVLPLIGFSAAALFFAQYQVFFLVMGVLSNIIGILMMLNIMQKINLRPNTNIFSGIFRYNMLRVRNRMVIASVVILAVVLTVSMFPAQGSLVSMAGGANTNGAGVINLQTLTNSENMVTIDVTPVNFEFGKEAVFNIELNTHQGDLDFDVTDIATLKDSNGNVYSPLVWDGSPSGGHHRSGRLTFPPVQESGYMELTLKDIYGVTERVFRWEL